MTREDLTGKQFSNWIVIEYAGDRKWLCECQCELHTRRSVSASTLKSGKSTSCGLCNKVEYNLTDMQFGELKVIKYTGKDNKWLCECSCGALVEKTSKHLKNGVCKTCGNQHNANLKKQQLQKMIPKYSAKKPKYKPAGDWTVLGQASRYGYYICQCICGYKREMSDSSIYNARKNNYQCKHKIPVGTIINNLEVIGLDSSQPAGKQYKCICKKCGKIVYYVSYSLLNKLVNSCGCQKAEPTYTKEQILQVINKYMMEHNGSKPQPLILKDILGLGETATYENIKRYGLEDLLDRHSSVGEKEVANIFKGQNVIRHDRKILGGKELDIYLPNLSIAIEYNGSFWHLNERKDKKYHQDKTIACAKQGIHLIHIFDYEWVNTIKKVKLTNYLKGLLLQNKIYHARNLHIQVISNSVAKDFQDKYHLQGSTDSEYNIALTDNNEILSIMSFRSPRFDHSYEWEITRYCNKDGIGIVGGAERLFKHFITENKPTSILTYIDITKFTGNVYTRLGFKPTKDYLTIPNYVWVNKEFDVLPRYKTQKRKLLAKGLGKEEQTENEIMKTLGYYKVYDSGNLKLEWLKEKGDTSYVQ